MVSIIIFLIIFGQLAAIAAGSIMEIKPLFDAFVVHASPIMVFFSGLYKITGFNGAMSLFFLPALAYCLFKYIFLVIALKNDELGFCNFGALVMEVIYVAYSSYFVVTHNYF